MPITFDQFISKWSGKKADWDGAYGGQCVDLFRFYVNEVLDLPQPRSVRGAGDFWHNYDSDPILKDNFKKIPNTPDFVPIKGDVMIWNYNAGDGFGHIGMVMDGATTGKFTSFDQNWRALNVSEPTGHYYTNVYGVLRPNVLSNPDDMPKTYTEEEMTQMREARDANWDLYQDALAQLEECEATTTSKEKTVKQLQADHQKYLDTLASILWGEGEPTLADEASIREKLEQIITKADKVDELTDRLNRQEQDAKKKYLSYEEELSALKKEMEVMRDDHARQMSNMEARVDKKMAELQKAKEVYEVHTRMGKLIKGILGFFQKGKNE